VWFNGEFCPWGDAHLHFLSHGLHFGSSVFEGLRAYNGKVFLLESHVQRLARSANLLGFALPMSVERIMDAILALVETSGIPNAYIRPCAWRGAESVGVSAKGTTVQCAIAIWEAKQYYSDAQGVNLVLAPWCRPPPECFPHEAKAAGAYTISTLSRQIAEGRGFDDALLLDWRGRLTEATAANLFLVINGEIHTPSPVCFLDGLTRRTVIGLARRHSLRVVEREILPSEIGAAQEIFLTGTSVEVCPVKKVCEISFETGPITRLLKQGYSELVRP
jgi:branched-chain amino acid aminotransferase